MYFLISGGEVGTAPNNPSIAMVAVIPTLCGGGHFFVDISETTTIAAAYALGSFATLSTDSFATNSDSTSALQSAVGYSSTLIDTANAVIPNGSAWQTTLNTLGDMIEACVNSASECPTLFAAATPPGGTAPTDTFQAALNIALNPNMNLTTLFNAIPSSPDFGPILSTVPASWTLPGSSVQITGVTPNPAPAGTPVTIVGSGFGAAQGNGVVIIGGIQASASSWSDTAIVVTVPAGAASNGVTQVFQNGFPSNPFPYSIGPLIGPTIIGLSLPQGPVGMGFVITGSNFGPASTVSMGDPLQGLLMVLSWSPTAITVQIPQTIVSGGNVVVTDGGLPSNGVNFTLTAPFGCSTP
ncbi:IPT/TIG domain-containing protein [Tunturibacter empetritectus]|uniref:IPT/TIG domain-containing protein n=1 Tax=Tunturiibacter empetritectus TaxID=3069691 RepID=UPI0033413A7B